MPYPIYSMHSVEWTIWLKQSICYLDRPPIDDSETCFVRPEWIGHKTDLIASFLLDDDEVNVWPLSMFYPEYSATTFNAHDLGAFGSIPVSSNVASIASYIVSNLIWQHQYFTEWKHLSQDQQLQRRGHSVKKHELNVQQQWFQQIQIETQHQS